MPCDQRAMETLRQTAIKRLEAQLKDMTARITMRFGRVRIEGWRGDRTGWCDDCALAALRLSSDFVVRRLVQTLDQPGQVQKR